MSCFRKPFCPPGLPMLHRPCYGTLHRMLKKISALMGRQSTAGPLLDPGNHVEASLVERLAPGHLQVEAAVLNVLLHPLFAKHMNRQHLIWQNLVGSAMGARIKEAPRCGMSWIPRLFWQHR